jgi:hypothetical protein
VTVPAEPSSMLVIFFKDQKSNRRRHLPDYAAGEIHPVMKIEVIE